MQPLLCSHFRCKWSKTSADLGFKGAKSVSLWNPDDPKLIWREVIYTHCKAKIFTVAASPPKWVYELNCPSFKDQFEISGLPETLIRFNELRGAIFMISYGCFFYSFKLTSHVQENDATLFCREAPERVPSISMAAQQMTITFLIFLVNLSFKSESHWQSPSRPLLPFACIIFSATICFRRNIIFCLLHCNKTHRTIAAKLYLLWCVLQCEFYAKSNTHKEPHTHKESQSD